MEPNRMTYAELKVLAQKVKIPKNYIMNKAELSLALGLGPVIKRRKSREYCRHGRIERFCVPCGGSAICPHGIRKYVCIPCGGSQLCKHFNQKHQCRECKRERLAQEHS